MHTFHAQPDEDLHGSKAIFCVGTFSGLIYVSLALTSFKLKLACVIHNLCRSNVPQVQKHYFWEQINEENFKSINMNIGNEKN